MALVLPTGHPASHGVPPAPAARRAVRIGLLNIMPRLEEYEASVLGPLGRVGLDVEPVFLRLTSHGYTSSDHAHLDRFYRPLDEALRQAPLDGLILTGAPVEELPFREVRYWDELSAILTHARAHIPSTLGLCWGGMALGGHLGLDKRLFRQKLFGVFEHRLLHPGHPLLDAPGGTFPCAHSRHSGIDDEALREAARDGVVRLLSHSEETGFAVFETPDHRFVAHQGHPEYVAARLVFEWERDRAQGRTDVDPPRHLDLTRPETSWYTHRESLFSRWVRWVADAPR